MFRLSLLLLRLIERGGALKLLNKDGATKDGQGTPDNERKVFLSLPGSTLELKNQVHALYQLSDGFTQSKNFPTRKIFILVSHESLSCSAKPVIFNIHSIPEPI